MTISFILVAVPFHLLFGTVRLLPRLLRARPDVTHSPDRLKCSTSRPCPLFASPSTDLRVCGFFFDDGMTENSKLIRVTQHRHHTLRALLNAPHPSVRNPLPLRGIKGLRRQSPPRCDVPGARKQTPLLLHKTESRCT